MLAFFELFMTLQSLGAFCSQLDMISTGCLGITGGKTSAFLNQMIVYHSAQAHTT